MYNSEKSCNSKKTVWKKWLRGVFVALLLMTASLAVTSLPKEVKAASEGFKMINGKGYYIKKDGQRASS